MRPGSEGDLYIVATPIGNLKDVTLRALEVLRACDFIVCEDTRRTLRLLDRYGIRKEVTAAHRFNEEKSAGRIINRLRRGQSAAYVSEGGTPAVSDPGARLVRRVRGAGFPVIPIPGASAVTAAVSVAGWEGGFVFAGFAERKKAARARQIEALSRLPWAGVLFESPSRVRATLETIDAVLKDRQILVAREMTKIHEQVAAAPAAKILDLLPVNVKGEITIVILPQRRGRGKGEIAHAGRDMKRVAAACGEMMRAGLKTTKAAAIAASLTGIPKKTILELLQQ